MARGNTDLRVTIEADAAKLEREMQRASRSMQQFESQLRQADVQAAALERSLDQQREQAVRQLGQAMLAFGTATLAGLGMAVKAAIDWESAWTGVEKVIQGTPQQLQALEADLRNIARTGFAHEEVAAVAQALGQLGFATDDIAQLTQVMLDMGVATNLSAEEAAFAIARMSNIMGTSADDVQRLGSVIVDLGNNSATTERDIVQMALRIAGAGNTIGLSEADVLAFSAALSSVGIEAAAGGTSISRVMIEIANSVAAGGDAVEGFADVAGMSAQQFAQAFEEDPAAAIAAFVVGLGDINDAGGNVFETLNELGLGEIRVRDALLRLSGAGDLLVESLDRGSGAWDQNTALVEEAERRYDTAEVKIQGAKSSLVDLAIDIGSVLLPVFVDLLEKVTGIIQWFGDLPGPVQAVITIFGALVGAVATLAGGFLLLGPRMVAFRQNVAHFARTAPVATGAVLTLGSALAKLGVAAAAGFLGVEVLQMLGFEATNSLPVLDSATGSIALRFATMGATSREMASGVGEATEALLNLGDGMRATGEGDRIEDSLINILRNTQELGEVSENAAEQLEVFDLALANMASGGNAGQAEESLTAIQEALGLTDEEMEHLVSIAFPRYRDALAENRVSERKQAEQIEEVDLKLLDLANRFGITADDAEEAAQKMLDSWTQSSRSFISLTDAYGDALEKLEEKEQKRAQDAFEANNDIADSWEDLVGDVEVSIDDFLAELDRQIEAQANWHQNMAILSSRVSDEMIAELARLGPEGAPLVQALVDASEEKLQEADEKWGKATADGTNEIIGELIAAGPILSAIAEEHGQEVADQIAHHMVENKQDVFTAADELGVEIDSGMRAGEDREIPVHMTGRDQLLTDLQSVGDAVRGIPDSWTVGLALNYHRQPKEFGMHTGGPVDGHGHPDIDSIPVMLAPGEYVMKAAARRKYGDKMMHAINAGRAELGEGGPIQASEVVVDNQTPPDTAGDFIDSVRHRAAAMLAASGLVSGTVLPRGSYRIGRGSAAHGYGALDLPAPIGTPVYSVAPGIVSRAIQLATSYGIHAFVNHPGNRQSRYAHLSSLAVTAGQVVNRGQLLGRVGSTGNSTGPHLHYEDLLNGIRRAPENLGIFDLGGWLEPGMLGANTSNQPEAVLTQNQWSTLESLVASLAGMGIGLGESPEAGFVLDQARRWIPDEIIPEEETPAPGIYLDEYGRWVLDRELEQVDAPAPGIYMIGDEWIPKSLDDAETIDKLVPGFIITRDGEWMPKNLPPRQTGGGGGGGGSGRGGGGGGGGGRNFRRRFVSLIPPGDFYGRGEFTSGEWSALMRGVDDYVDHVKGSSWRNEQDRRTEERRAKNSLRLHGAGQLPDVGKFDTGGKWVSGTLGVNMSGSTEYVLSPSQSRMFDRFISSMESPAGAGGGLRLHPEDRALLRAIADRPVQADLTVDGRVLASANADASRDMRRTGARGF